MNLPDGSMLRIELQLMEQTLNAAIVARSDLFQRMIKSAIDSYSTTENLQYVVDCQAKDCIDGAIKEEITRFFRYGKGRDVVKAAVSKMLEDEK